MEYRRANIEDIDILIELRKKQLIDEGISPDNNIDQELYTFFKKTLENDSLVEWILEDNEKVVATGAVIFYEFPPTYTNKSGIKGYVTNMYTSPEYRGRGIATNMLERIVEEAKKRKVEKLCLIASKMGRPIYLKYGFIETDEWLELNNIK